MAVDKYVNIEKKIRDKYMFIYRMLCIVLMVLIPVFWIITKITCPDIKTPVLFREALIILSAIILIGSFKSKWVQKNMQNVMMVLYALVTLWQLIVLNWNNFEPNQSIGFILVAFGLSIGFESRKHYLYFITFFLGSVSTLLLTNPDAIVGKVVFLVTLSSILLLSCVKS